jgi:hypothetical protein
MIKLLRKNTSNYNTTYISYKNISYVSNNIDFVSYMLIIFSKDLVKFHIF